jgi:hypothetical protein
MRAQLTRLGSLNRVAATAAAAMKVCLGARKLTASERDGDGALAGVAVGKSLLVRRFPPVMLTKETVRKTRPGGWSRS